MTRKLIAMLALTFALSACESETPDNNSNANAARPTATTATPAPTSPAPEASPAARAELKAGDKVKATVNGSSVQATVVSVDEKAGKVTVSVPGEKENRTLTIADVVKQ